MQELTEYWKIKRGQTERLFKGLSAGTFPGQPPVVKVDDPYGNYDERATKQGCYLYIVSKRSLSRNSTPGQVTLADLSNASRGLVEETHEIATKEQISGFEASQVANKKKMDSLNWDLVAKKEIVREIIREVPVPAAVADDKSKK